MKKKEKKKGGKGAEGCCVPLRYTSQASAAEGVEGDGGAHDFRRVRRLNVNL